MEGIGLTLSKLEEWLWFEEFRQLREFVLIPCVADVRESLQYVNSGHVTFFLDPFGTT